ncbi:PhnA domain-containing protein [Alteromonas halophila]|uniref:PhnA domain protein n=1 Tax=Alteromonas halophila TaxID=516698 RepID=A0A918JJE0_9ALTE|nr:alkylphosphonate utilization protein [Alteromonas halophila]GGW83354.1 PhnA domain protein [Alteromonas halophila]
MIEQAVRERAEGQCELCQSQLPLSLYAIPDSPVQDAGSTLALCETCQIQLSGDQAPDMNHWRCLSDAIWSTVPGVQVVAWRMLQQLNSEAWAQDLIDIAYLQDDVRVWAEAGLADADMPSTTDSNGTVLNAGDTVHLVKDLPVKGAGFTAKRGTMVRNISLTQNPDHIEGKVNGTHIVIIAGYTKKV